MAPMENKNIKVNELVFVDDKEVKRMVISSDLPDPQVDGKTYKRDVSVSGMQFLDENGDEIGGLGIIEGQRTALFGLDYKNHEAVVVYAYDNKDGFGSGVSVNAKDEKAKADGVKKYARIEIKTKNNLPVIAFVGKDGKEKMILGLDSEDIPFIKVLKDNDKLLDII